MQIHAEHTSPQSHSQGESQLLPAGRARLRSPQTSRPHSTNAVWGFLSASPGLRLDLGRVVVRQELYQQAAPTSHLKATYTVNYSVNESKKCF